MQKKTCNVVKNILSFLIADSSFISPINGIEIELRVECSFPTKQIIGKWNKQVVSATQKKAAIKAYAHAGVEYSNILNS